MTTDTIADMLTRIRNANLARHQVVQIPSTKVTKNIAQVLFTEGLIDSFEELKNGLKSSLPPVQREYYSSAPSKSKMRSGSQTRSCSENYLKTTSAIAADA